MAQAHAIYIGWRTTNAVPTAAQIVQNLSGNANTDSNSVTIPNFGNAVGYIFIWRADADGGDPTEIHLGSSGNARNGWGTTTDRTISVGGVSVPGKVIVSVNTFNVALTEAEVSEGNLKCLYLVALNRSSAP